MEGLLRIFEFNHGSMAKKVHAHKRRHGLEPPRNSLELQAEASQIQCQQRELPYHYQVEDLSVNTCHSDAVSVKKLINDELGQRSTAKQNVPSIVARLMGIDMMPSDAESAVRSDEIKGEKMGKKHSDTEVNRRGSGGRSSFGNSNSCSHMEVDSSCYQDRGGGGGGDNDDDDGRNQYLGKPKPREHPQEEELQKFKKEFEAFEAARLMECSKVVGVGSTPRQLLGRESMDKKNMAGHATSHKLATKLPNKIGPEYRGNITEFIPPRHRETFPSRSRTLSRDFEESLMMKSNRQLDGSSPTRIVILKLGPDRIYSHEDNWINRSSILQGRNSIEDFLDEVRERLKCELQGKIFKKGIVVRGSGIETRYNEKPSDPKQIARNIAKQVRERVTRDVATNLLRSESTRSYRSEMQFNGSSSPEFINRDTRRLLSERLRNVLKRKAPLDIPEVTCGNSGSYLLDNHNDRLKQGDGMNSDYLSHWEISKEEKAMQTGSFSGESVDNIFLPRELSPRNLVRSLSAPVSGTSFGKLLLEDRHILTGAQIRRKLEAIETVSVDVKKKKKDRFNIKERVSNFKYSLVLRGKLFGKKIQSMAESHSNEDGPMMVDVISGPTILLNCGERHENSTEVPPSPASVCSNAHEELWKRAEYLSPISTPDVSSRDDNSMPEVFREISSGLNESRRQINELESDGPKESMVKQGPEESELVQLEDPAESYVRDLLVASGLYFGSWDKYLLEGDTLAKPIGNSVFEEVEESHKKMLKENEISPKDQSDNNSAEHRLLHDLLNEALFIVLGPSSTLSRFKGKLSSFSSMQPAPRGRELLKLVWEIIRVSLYPRPDATSDSLDTLVARDLGSNPWVGLIDDEFNILKREIERLVIEDLVEELSRDMVCC